MVKLGVDFRRLRYFIAVCDHGGFSRASDAIGIAQPALTRQIKLLENEMGLPLVERSGRGTVPTEEGRYLLARSREHLDILDSLVTKTRGMFLDSRKQLSLGICPTITPLFLEMIQAYIADSHPNVGLSVIQAYSGDLANLMSNGRLDIALTYRPSDRLDWNSVDLLSERLVLVTGPNPLNGSASLPLAQLSGLKLILPSKIHQLRRIIDRVCADRGVELNPELELDSLTAVKAILPDKSSEFATILPYNSIEDEVREGKLAYSAIDEPAMVRTISVVSPKNGHRPRVEGDVVSRVREHAKWLKEQLPSLS